MTSLKFPNAEEGSITNVSRFLPEDKKYTYRRMEKLSPLAQSLIDRYKEQSKKMAFETGPMHDHWSAREAWRYHPFFSPKNSFRILFYYSGIGLGASAFAVYWFAEFVYSKAKNTNTVHMDYKK